MIAYLQLSALLLTFGGTFMLFRGVVLTSADSYIEAAVAAWVSHPKRSEALARQYADGRAGFVLFLASLLFQGAHLAAPRTWASFAAPGWPPVVAALLTAAVLFGAAHAWARRMRRHVAPRIRSGGRPPADRGERAQDEGEKRS